MKERDPIPEPTIIDILNDSLRKGTNDPDNFPTVEIIACMSSEHLGQREQFAKVWFPG
jgi:hypothetical protein